MARNSTNSKNFIPLKPQLAFLEAYLSQEIDSTIESICTAAGVPRRTYYNWREHPEFNEWFLAEVRNATNRFSPAVLVNLFKKASSPDATAAIIELALEVAELIPKAEDKAEEANRSFDADKIRRLAAERAIELFCESDSN